MKYIRLSLILVLLASFMLPAGDLLAATKKSTKHHVVHHHKVIVKKKKKKITYRSASTKTYTAPDGQTFAQYYALTSEREKSCLIHDLGEKNLQTWIDTPYPVISFAQLDKIDRCRANYR